MTGQIDNTTGPITAEYLRIAGLLDDPPRDPVPVKGLPSTRAGVTLRRVVCGERSWLELICETGRTR